MDLNIILDTQWAGYSLSAYLHPIVLSPKLSLMQTCLTVYMSLRQFSFGKPFVCTGGTVVSCLYPTQPSRYFERTFLVVLNQQSWFRVLKGHCTLWGLNVPFGSATKETMCPLAPPQNQHIFNTHLNYLNLKTVWMPTLSKMLCWQWYTCNKCLVLTITTFKMRGVVMRYYSSPLACKFRWEHCLDSEQTNEIAPGPYHTVQGLLASH